jgi:formylglycine-generating enzyme required for sulfatase activity
MGDHVFICYAREDQDFVLKLATNLKARGAPVWLDQWDIPPGADWDRTIDEALDGCARFLIVLSPAVDSLEVRGELHAALKKNKPIVPVLYRPCNVPRQLLPIQYVDFTAHGPDDETALRQVTRALGVVEEKGPAGKGKAAPTRPPFEPEMVLIPAGQFLMGSDPQKDELADDNEQPQHPLYLPDYYLARTPLTNAQYAAFVQATDHRQPDLWEGGKPPDGKEDHPVVEVSWDDAVAYCNWLAEVTGRPYRLPSEAEWEKGARGGDGRIYPWGDEWDAQRCNNVEGGPGDTTPVGAYPEGASPYGLLDMAGNVWEWTRSIYRGYPYDPVDGREDLQAGGPRVLRGGSFYADQGDARCACRRRYFPDVFFFFSVGFRVVVAPGS